MTCNLLQMVLYCLDLHTQNPGLRQVDFKYSPKSGSDKINMLKQGGNTQKKASRIFQPALTYGSQHLERQTWNPVLRVQPTEPEPPSEHLLIISKLVSS